MNHIASVNSTQIKQPHKQTQNIIFTLKITFRANNAELRLGATFEQTQNAIFTFKIAFSSLLIWNLLQGASQHKMQSLLQETMIH
jgi:hypothetical protein